MIYSVKYNIEKNEFNLLDCHDFNEWETIPEPFWVNDENIFMYLETETLEEANLIAADKICKYFDGKREEALEEAAKYTLEVSKYEKLARAVRYAKHIVGDKKKIYSVCYFAAEDRDKLFARELPDEDNQIVCDKVYRTNDCMYEVFVKAADEKEAKIKGVEAIAKFVEGERVAARNEADDAYDREMKLRDMRVWLENKAEELRGV